MCNLLYPFLLLILWIDLLQKGHTQYPILNIFIAFPDKLIPCIDQATSSIENKLGRQTEIYLNKLQRHENSLKKIPYQKYFTQANQLFSEGDCKYTSLKTWAMLAEHLALT